MIRFSIICLISLLLALSTSTANCSLIDASPPSNEGSKRIVCYYTYPNNPPNLYPEDIDAQLCTHILIGFSTLLNNSINLSKEEENVIVKVMELKKQNSNLKIMLSLGGGGGEYGFPYMVQNESNRAEFVQSVESVISRLDLDGIDLDWEFPNNILKKEKENFSKLLEDLRASSNKSIEKYLISVAVAAPITIVEVSYNVPEMNKFVDFINLMAYDYNFYSFWTPWTGMNAPLNARSTDKLYFATQNIKYSSHFWAKKGMDKDKINVGLPTYAHTYTLRSPNKTYLGAPATGDGKLGGGGSAKYGTVCDFMKKNNLKPVFDEETKSPYVTDGTEWVSFENDQSMKYKAEFVRDNDYGGVMVFSLNSDDFKGRCKDGYKFPNTNMIKKAFIG